MPEAPLTSEHKGRPVSKAALLLLTFFLGGLGAHKFYLGKNWQGAFCLIFFWTYIPALIALVEFFIYVFTSAERLNEKYSAHGSVVIIVIVGAVVVMMVIGILAAIAIPAHLDRVDRSRVAGAIFTVGPWRVAVTEHYLENRKLPNSAAELRKEALPAQSGDNFSALSLGANGALTVTMSQATGGLAGKTMVFRPQAAQGEDLSWDCTGGTLEPRYRPSTCRPRR